MAYRVRNDDRDSDERAGGRLMVYNDPPVNPYDPQSTDHETQTRPMDVVIRDAIKAHALQLRVCLPARITKIVSNQVVDVQPCLQVRYIDQDAGQNMPQIQQVPVSMPMGSDYSIKLPLAVGDTGYLIFSDRSIDAWLAGDGGIVDPADSRQHDIADPIFVPGLVPFGKQTTDSTSDLVLTNGQAILRLQKGGHFVLRNSSNELIDVLDQITQQVKEITDTLKIDTVNTIFGPEPLLNFQVYADISTQLETLIAKLETLKGT